MKLKSASKAILLFVLFLSAVVFVYLRTLDKFYGEIVVQLENENYSFVDKLDVIHLISEESNTQLSSVRWQDLSLRSIEKKVKSYNFVSNCEVARDLKGNLLISIQQKHPIARILDRNATRKGGYISAEGKLLPLSKQFTARVLLLSGKGTSLILNGNFLRTPKGKTFVEFLNYVDKNPFWKAQITQVEVDKKGRLTLLPQVGGQKIQFGEAGNYQVKLQKLEIFYNQIIPTKGWNRYKQVNLEFEDQIVCS